MTNLLPPETLHMLDREYMVRMGTTTMFMLTITSLLGALSLLPAYIVLKENVDTLSYNQNTSQLVSESRSRAVDVSALERLTLDTTLAQFTLSNSGAMTDSISRVLALSNSTTRVTSFIVQRSPTERTYRVGLEVAGREDALRFQEKVRKFEAFTKVQISLQDLARGEGSMEISFSEKLK
jgi:hypothetical protein